MVTTSDPAALLGNDWTELTVFAHSMMIGASTTFTPINGVAISSGDSRMYVGLPYDSEISAFVPGGLVVE